MLPSCQHSIMSHEIVPFIFMSHIKMPTEIKSDLTPSFSQHLQGSLQVPGSENHTRQVVDFIF